VRLGPYKKVPNWIELDPGCKVSHEMIAACVIGARACERAAIEEILVEADALGSNACLQVKRGSLSERWSINSVEIIKNWAERKSAEIVIARGAPRNLGAKTEVVGKKVVAAEGQVCAARDRLREMIAAGIPC